MSEEYEQQKNNIGGRLKNIRKEMGLRKKDIANFLGVSPGIVAFYEDGRRLLSLAGLLQFGKVNPELMLYIIGYRDFPYKLIEEMKKDRDRIIKIDKVNSIYILCDKM